MESYHDRSTRDESRVINALLIEPKSREVIFDRLHPEHFADTAGKQIFEGLLSCWRRNMSLDADGTVAAIAPAGDPVIDNFINQGLPGHYSAKWQDSLEVLDRLELTRQVIWKGTVAIDAAQQADKDRAELLSTLGELWTPVLEAPVSASTMTLEEVMEEEARAFQEAREGLRKAVPWGLIELDRRVPVYPGQMCIVAARPGMGKTALMITAAMAQLEAGYKVGIISVEADAVDILRRFYAQLSGLTYDEIQRGLRGCAPDLLEKYSAARETMRGYHDQLFIQGGEKVSIPRIKAIGYDWVKGRGVGCLWLDYLTDFKLPKRKDHHLSVEAASQEIRDLSRKDKLNIPVFLLAQLNRGGADGYPRANHLKGSSGLEQDAHVIVLVDRPDIDSTANRPYLDSNGSTRDMVGKAALHIAKNRNGRPGLSFSGYDGPAMKFYNESKYSAEVI